MSIVNGSKIVTLVSAANGDAYGDGLRHELRTQQALIQANVISIGVNTPPISPSSGNNGFTYVVGTAPTGLWTGQANAIAYSATDPQDGNSVTPSIATGAWEFYTPLAGWQVYDNTTSAYWQFNGTVWNIVTNVVPNFADEEIPAGATPGTAFTLAAAPNPVKSLQLFWNGVLQKPSGVDYTLSGTNLTTTQTIQSGDSLLAWYRH